MSNEIAPFYLGQRVMCIDVSSRIGSNASFDQKPISVLIKNKDYVVSGIYKACCNWVISVGIKSKHANITCATCGSIYLNQIKGEWAFRATRFAPILENFQSISLSKILEEETKLLSVN